jgi:hypothetical protein
MNLLHNRVFLLTAAATALCVGVANAGVYTFNDLVIGPLSGQDSWGATSNASVVATTNGSLGFTGGAAARQNTPAWSFPTITATTAQVGFDFRVDPSATYSVAEFVLWDQDETWLCGDGEVGVSYSFLASRNPMDRLLVHRGDCVQYAGAAVNFAHQHGDWYRVRMTMDLSPTFYSTSEGIFYGRGSVTVQNLTAGSPPVAVGPLQNIALMIPADVDTSTWDLMDIEAQGVTIDNLYVLNGAAPTPDLDQSGHVDGADLAILLGQWGSAGSADLDESGEVDAADLAILLGAWG